VDPALRPLKLRLADPDGLARALGLVIEERHGRGVLCRCPVHGNQSGSLDIRVAKDKTLQIRCYGCGLTGDVLTLLGRIEGSFAAGVERARRLTGCEAPPLRPAAPPMDPDEYHELARRILDEGRLDGRPIARPVEAYLRRRGLLGAARESSWAALPSLRLFDAGQLLRAQLLRRKRDGSLGLVWGHHRLVIPWRDRGGRITALQRRLVREPRATPNGREEPRYVQPWAPSWPYGSDALPRAARLLIVEGAIDALAARLLGRGSVDVLGLPGVASWRSRWAELVQGRTVLVGLDRGKPGLDGTISEDRIAARIAVDCAGRGSISPSSCALCGAPTAWLCEGCGRRRAPPGHDWGSLWAERYGA